MSTITKKILKLVQKAKIIFARLEFFRSRPQLIHTPTIPVGFHSEPNIPGIYQDEDRRTFV